MWQTDFAICQIGLALWQSDLNLSKWPGKGIHTQLSVSYLLFTACLLPDVTIYVFINLSVFIKAKQKYFTINFNFQYLNTDKNKHIKLTISKYMVTETWN